MTYALWTSAGLGLLLGLRHAFEPDHLAAVSTLATRQHRLWDGAALGLAWGAGHSVSVGAVALVVAATGLSLPDSLSAAAELGVAAILVLLGVPVVWRYARGRWHMHAHTHDGDAHLHLHSHAASPSHAHRHARWDRRRSLGLGLAHGLAGSAAIVVLLVASAPTPGQRVAYLAAFATGTIAGMLAVSLALVAVVRTASHRGAHWAAALHVGAAAASVAAGLALSIRTVNGWQ
ncbi:MAG: urease accessory protein [Gemmatimonadales bacterium]